MTTARLTSLALAACLTVSCAGDAVQPSRPPASTGTPAPSLSPTAPSASPTEHPTGEPPAVSAAPTATASASPAGFDPALVRLAFEPFASGLEALTFLTHAADGSGLLYAIEQRGTVRTIDQSGNVSEQVFLDIRDRVRAGGEQGLLGLAFHPQFAANGRVFVNYTDLNGDTVVSELRSEAGGVDAASERVVLAFDQPRGNHNGGMLAFGPDGYLYVGTGDGGGGGDPLGAGQDLATLLGKILRIDVDGGEPYAIPADNPFVQLSNARPEIWALGLRNPWRFSFDRQTGDLFIGDVGQGAWEEVDAQPAGAGGRNYGWNVVEGPDCFAVPDCDATGITMPVAAYPRVDGNCAVTGGYVYRGQRFASLGGAYLFSDYCGGGVWALDAQAAIRDGRAQITEMAQSGINPGSFGEDEAGELYLAGQGGEVLRIVAGGP